MRGLMHPDTLRFLENYNATLTRRHFFRKTATGLGVAALSSLLGPRAFGLGKGGEKIAPAPWRIAPKAKRAIYISLIGAASQVYLFDYKPGLQARFKEDLKDWLKQQGERLTGMTAGQDKFPLAPSIFKFAQYGKSGTWVSELLPWHAKMVDDLFIVKSLHTDAINHEPANQLVYTGSMI